MRTFLLGLCCTVASLGQAAERPGEPVSLESSVRSVVNPILTKGPWRGLLVGVRQDTKSSFFAFGQVADDPAVKPSETSVFEMGSITKTFTSLLLALALEEGLVALDDPIQKHLPEGVKAPVTGETPITFLHLATHRSGLPRLPPNLRPFGADPYADYDRKALWAALGVTKLQAEPGTKFDYSNFGTGLLGELLSVRFGVSFRELVAERIAKPLELGSTYQPLADAPVDLRFLPGHAQAMGFGALVRVPAWHFQSLAGAGALRTSAPDLLKYLALQWGTGPEGLVRAAALQLVDRGVPDQKWEAGLGWLRAEGRDPARPPVFWHNGGTGGFRTFSGFVREEKLAVCVLSNAVRDEVDQIGFELIKNLRRPR